MFLDTAGDMIGVFEWNVTAAYDNEWYVPIQDLVEIYKAGT